MPTVLTNAATSALRTRSPGRSKRYDQILPALLAAFLLLAAAVTIAGYRLGFYDLPLSIALLVLAFVLPFTAILRFDNRALQKSALHSRHADASADRVLQSIGDAVIVTDPQLRVLRMNPIAEALTGFTFAESLNRPMAEVLNTLDEITRNPHENPAARVLRLKSNISIATRSIIVHKDGSEQPIDDSASPIYADDGEVLGVVVVFRSLAARRQADSALIKTQKLAAAGRLAGTIVHEINNPLSAVTNLLYLARITEDHSELDQYLELAEKELGRISTITSQTLSYYRHSNSPAPAEIDQVLDSVLVLHKPHIRQAQIVVDRRRPHLDPVSCFEGEIRQVLSNLIGNAIDAIRATGPAELDRPSPQLFIRSHQGHHWPTGRTGIFVTIADRGTGIPQATLRQLGEPFFTTKGAEGTGLGLWVSREIIARHNGSLRIRSSQSLSRHGSVFTLFLPHQATTR